MTKLEEIKALVERNNLTKSKKRNQCDKEN